jgi:hypothetical protein
MARVMARETTDEPTREMARETADGRPGRRAGVARIRALGEAPGRTEPGGTGQGWAHCL